MIITYPFYQLRLVRYSVAPYLRVMRNNRKYSKEEMYLAIELWQESGLSQAKFCSCENLPVTTFSYWYRKYKKENGFLVDKNKEALNSFIPVKVSEGVTSTLCNECYARIEISFPNGVQVSCPVGIDASQLKNLINL